MRKQRTALVFICGTVVGALVSSAAITLTATQDSSPRAINLPGRTTTAPFSDAVLVGDTLYVAGRLGLEPGTGSPPASVAQEVRIILDGIQAVLAEADMTMDDLVNVQVFCSDVSLYGEFNQVYTEYFNDDPPARAFLGSGPLLFGARFEVNGIAVRG